MRLDRVSFARRLEGYSDAINLPSQPILEGRLLRMVGLTLEAEGLRAAIGSRCLVINEDSYHPVQVEAEVMGFSSGNCFLKLNNKLLKICCLLVNYYSFFIGWMQF